MSHSRQHSTTPLPSVGPAAVAPAAGLGSYSYSRLLLSTLNRYDFGLQLPTAAARALSGRSSRPGCSLRSRTSSVFAGCRAGHTAPGLLPPTSRELRIFPAL